MAKLLQVVLLLQSFLDIGLVVLSLTMHPVLFDHVLVDSYTLGAARDSASLLGLYVRSFGWLAVALGLLRLQGALQPPSFLSFGFAAVSQLLELVWFSVEVWKGSFDFERECGGEKGTSCPGSVVGAIIGLTFLLSLWCGVEALFAGSSKKPGKSKVK
uniref:Uncharacterized protein n=1 Tax=Chromera velia CCMP2878 TaxID=1169474 RepID=A0A0G4FIN0_9ALVE|mmetsp:Transcript_3422/g.7082  ORF Transcript_3422/g.7082 Transcript_3422/m.7082 type:complete len:158 (-) Transcript_3422:210-683(-)|eukprot:Cvel_17242.t1-p1 / transcript=Cvel_17242.t1 / gene=Cvel_17242 / organism=Chromera_velia_CCMP2878 / gene_product=hypothetical protein / transcript_product=hypothetical protein / location=Cvel_scaffold1365:22364-22834(-) / protein_length=157 / sequence_SO=supercontig / SO=protein_coding / is_pseudo=false